MITGAVARRDQRVEALNLANVVRLARARHKRQLAELTSTGGLQTAADWIEDPPMNLEGMKVRELLGSVHRWGEARTDRAFRYAGISSVKTIDGLTDRQREALVGYLRARA